MLESGAAQTMAVVSANAANRGENRLVGIVKGDTVVLVRLNGPRWSRSASHMEMLDAVGA